MEGRRLSRGKEEESGKKRGEGLREGSRSTFQNVPTPLVQYIARYLWQLTASCALVKYFSLQHMKNA